MSSRLSALLVWALVTASAVYWGLRLSASPVPVPDGTLLASRSNLTGGDLSALLGASAVVPAAAIAAPPPQSSRFRLAGVVATPAGRVRDARSSPGVALISVDGAPPKAFRVGEAIDPGLVLQSVALRSASIGTRSAAGDVAFVLELPPPAAAATGRPATGAGSGAPLNAGGPVPAPIPGTPFPSPSSNFQAAVPAEQQAAMPSAAGMNQGASLQMVPGVEVQSLPQAVQLQPPPGLKRSDEQLRSMRQ